MEKIYQRILVGMDGSKQAEQALKRAIQIANNNEAELYIAHVVDTSSVSSFASRNIDYEELVDDKVVHAMEKYETQALEAGVQRVNSLVEYGNPRLMISRTLVESYDIDLILVGATGMSTINRVFLGSVAEHIVRQAICDVTVVRDHNE